MPHFVQILRKYIKQSKQRLTTFANTSWPKFKNNNNNNNNNNNINNNNNNNNSNNINNNNNNNNNNENFIKTSQ